MGRGTWFLVAFNVLLLAGAAVGAEFYLRSTVFDPSKRYILLPGWELIERGSPENTPGIDREAHILVNRLGLRGEMPSAASSPRILALGSSMTMDVALNDEDTWTGQLQSGLRSRWPAAWVGNGGRSGATVHHHIAALKEMLTRWPTYDSVIVMLGTTDMIFDLRMHFDQATDPQTQWTEDQTFMFVPSPLWYERLATYQLVKRTYEYWRVTRTGPFPVSDLGKEQEIFKARRRRVQADDWIVQAQDLSAQLARFRSLTNELATVADMHKVQLILVTSPSPWKEAMTELETARLYAGGMAPTTEWEKNPRIKWWAVPPMIRVLELYNDAIRSVCVARALTCIDLAREVPRDSTYFYDDFHFSRAGAAAVGQTIARHLVGGDGIELKSKPVVSGLNH
jgi:lysophospholipase L1-like esterase